MNTGNVKVVHNRVKGLRFENDGLILAFRGGRDIHVPLRLHPLCSAPHLNSATPGR